MEKVEPKAPLKEADVLQIAFAAIVLTLVIIFVLIVLFWDQICAKVVLNALEQGVKQLITAQ